MINPNLLMLVFTKSNHLHSPFGILLKQTLPIKKKCLQFRRFNLDLCHFEHGDSVSFICLQSLNLSDLVSHFGAEACVAQEPNDFAGHTHFA